MTPSTVSGAPGYQRIILPRSLIYPPTSKENAEYSSHLQELKPISRKFDLTVSEVVEDLPARKIVMYLTAHADSLTRVLSNEYVCFMDFNEGGAKITAWKEFIDAGVDRDFCLGL